MAPPETRATRVPRAVSTMTKMAILPPPAPRAVPDDLGTQVGRDPRKADGIVGGLDLRNESRDH